MGPSIEMLRNEDPEKVVEQYKINYRTTTMSNVFSTSQYGVVLPEELKITKGMSEEEIEKLRKQ